MIQENWCTAFSVTLPPENSQYSRQLMNLNASNGRAARPLRNASHPTLSAVQSGGTFRTHCPWPCGVFRLIQDSACAPLPTRPCFSHCFASANAPVLTCCSPICTTCFDAFAALRHSSASAIDQVIVFSEYRSLPAAIVSTKC